MTNEQRIRQARKEVKEIKTALYNIYSELGDIIEENDASGNDFLNADNLMDALEEVQAILGQALRKYII